MGLYRYEPLPSLVLFARNLQDIETALLCWQYDMHDKGSVPSYCDIPALDSIPYVSCGSFCFEYSGDAPREPVRACNDFVVEIALDAVSQFQRMRTELSEVASGDLRSMQSSLRRGATGLPGRVYLCKDIARTILELDIGALLERENDYLKH